MTRGSGIGRVSVVALAAVIAALGWFIVQERTQREGLAANAPADLTATVQALPDAGQLPDISPDALAEIAARPVFSESRRPAEQKAKAPVARQSHAPTVDFRLIGVVATANRRLALVMPQGSSKVVQLGEGDTYRDWTVSEIGAAHVVLHSGKRQQEISLSYRPKQ
jgi:Type II secretion system protein C